MARHSGFRFVSEVAIPVAERRVAIVARNGLGDTGELVIDIAPAAALQVAGRETEAAEFRLEIDSPIIVDDVVKEPVSGRLTIDGWTLCRPGIAAVEVFLDDQRLADAHHGLARADVARAFPDWPGAIRSGFAFHCPPRLLRSGSHRAELRVRALNGEYVTRCFRFEVHKTEEGREGATIRRRISRNEADFYTRALDHLASRPTFQLIMLLPEPPEHVSSLIAQIHPAWHLLLLAANEPIAEAVRNILAVLLDDAAHRIEIATVSAAWPGSSAAPGLVGFLSPGDELGCDALAEIALAQHLSSEAELFYADESRISPVSYEREPFFKPDYSPDLLLATNYMGRLWFAASSLLHKLQASPASLMAAGEYDLLLHCSEKARAVAHIPRLLCERGPKLLESPEMERRALAEAAARRGISTAEIIPGPVPGNWRLRRTTPTTGLISIIIPTGGRDRYVETCIHGLRERTAYRNFEIICVENIREHEREKAEWLRDHADKVLSGGAAFNWSRFNNLGAAAASGDYLLFLNDDIEIEQHDWLEAMLEHAARPEVGVVGPRLLYPDRTVQHAGMFLTGFATGRHAFRLAAADDPGYFGLALTTREVSAVTGACMLMRREHFIQLGAFDESTPDRQQRHRFLLAHGGGRAQRAVHAPCHPDPSRAGQSRRNC
jgi:hypothetical protein